MTAARLSWATGLAGLLLALPATADDEPRGRLDGSHGRVEGDVTLSLGLGATFGPRAPRPTTSLHARYLSTAGVFAAYEDGPLLSASANPRRVFSFGGEWRPLFLARWFLGAETGRTLVDLPLDSLGVESGVFFAQPEGAALRAAPGLQLGLVAGVPLFASATGLWLAARAGARLGGAALEGTPTKDPAEKALYLSLELAWDQVLSLHVVDAP